MTPNIQILYCIFKHTAITNKKIDEYFPLAKKPKQKIERDQGLKAIQSKQLEIASSQL